MKNPCHAPIRAPTIRQMMIEGRTGQPMLTMRIPATAPTRQIIEPTERSMLPPVRIQRSIPVARITTHAFWLMRFVMFAGAKREPLSAATIRTWKNNITARRIKIIVLPFSVFFMFCILAIFLLLSLFI